MRDIARDQRWLRDLSLHQGLVGFRDLLFVFNINIFRKRPPENRLHDPVRLVHGFADQGIGVPEFRQHVDVLRPLSGIQKSDFLCVALAAEDTLRVERP